MLLIRVVSQRARAPAGTPPLTNPQGCPSESFCPTPTPFPMPFPMPFPTPPISPGQLVRASEKASWVLLWLILTACLLAFKNKIFKGHLVIFS